MTCHKMDGCWIINTLCCFFWQTDLLNFDAKLSKTGALNWDLISLSSVALQHQASLAMENFNLTRENHIQIHYDSCIHDGECTLSYIYLTWVRYSIARPLIQSHWQNIRTRAHTHAHAKGEREREREPFGTAAASRSPFSHFQFEWFQRFEGNRTN